MKKNFLVFLVIFILVIQFIGCQNSTTISNYFEAISSGNFDKAAQYVAFYETYNDILLNSDDFVIESYVNRLKNLKQNGIYLKSFIINEQGFDDGVPTGKVTMQIMNNNELIERDANIIMIRHEGKWKISDVNFKSNDSILMQFMEAISGKMGKLE